jgi:serine/threonine protein kinase
MKVIRETHMIGQTFSRYTILTLLDEGGMEVDFKAGDTRLKPTAALKCLPSQLTAGPESQKRFVQEAQAPSSLDHSNIYTIHEINKTDDGRLPFMGEHDQAIKHKEQVK